MTELDSAVIGAGPSGIATAIQLHRYGLDFRIFDEGPTGGLLRNANLVENYPGFPHGIPGHKLVALFEQQLELSGIKVVQERVLALDFVSGRFELSTSDHVFLARTVIVASGTSPRPFVDVPIPETVADRVFYEIVPLRGESGREIVIVGAGDAAFDYALNLTGYDNDNRVIILNRSDRVRSLPLLQNRVTASDRIDYHPLTRIKAIDTDKKAGLRLECGTGGGDRVFGADFLVFAIGRTPRLEFIADDLKRKMGELEENRLLHLVGDAKNDIFRQTAIGAGQGVMAAMRVYERLKETE